MPKIRGRLDLGDRREPDPWIGDLAGDDLPDLLSEQLVDPVSPLTHERSSIVMVLPCRSHGRSGA
jgi:hypothetical protein